MEYNSGNTMACLPQSWDWLEDRGDKNDKMPRRVWKVIEINARKIRMEKTKEGRKEGGRREETRKERVKKERRNKRKEKTKKWKDDESKESSRIMRNMG